MTDHHPFQSFKGQLLMAMPALADPNFEKTVTCISEHTAEGAVGIVINRLHPGLNARMIFDELEIPCGPEAETIPIYSGGPVHINELFILQSAPFDWEGHLPVTDQIALSNTRAVLEAIGQGQGPERFLIALGCAGWGGGQLEWEMKQNAWLTTPADMEIVFELPEANRWEQSIQRLGIRPDQLTDFAGSA